MQGGEKARVGVSMHSSAVHDHHMPMQHAPGEQEQVSADDIISSDMVFYSSALTLDLGNSPVMKSKSESGRRAIEEHSEIP